MQKAYMSPRGERLAGKRGTIYVIGGENGREDLYDMHS
jgi:hypothetical protein